MFRIWKRPKVKVGDPAKLSGETFGEKGLLIAKSHDVTEFVRDVVENSVQKASDELVRQSRLFEKVTEELKRFEEEYVEQAPTWECLKNDQLDSFVQIKEGDKDTTYFRRDVSMNELVNIRAASWWWYKHSPFGKVVPLALRTYTLGRGVKFNCQDEKVMEVLLDFWNHPTNSMERRHKKFFLHWFMDGDLTLSLWEDEEAPYLKVRRIAADELTDLVQDADDAEMVHVYVRDKQEKGFQTVKYGYQDWRRFYDPSYNFDDANLAENLPRDVKMRDDQSVLFAAWEEEGMENGRGFPGLFVILKRLRYLRNFLADRMMVNHFAARHFLILEVLNPTAAMRTSIDQYRPPRPGAVLMNTPERKWSTMNPEINATESAKDYEMLLRSLGVGYLMPEHIVSADASNNNYASIRKSDTPFTQFILDLQDDFKNEVIGPLLRAVIHRAVAMKVLPETTKIKRFTQNQLGEMWDVWMDWTKKNAEEGTLDEGYDLLELKTRLEAVGDKEEIEIKTVNIPIEQVYPEMVQEEPKAVAEAMDIWRRLGVVSLQTIAERAGFDWPIELARLSDESKRMAKQRDEELALLQKGVIPKEKKEQSEESA